METSDIQMEYHIEADGATAKGTGWGAGLAITLSQTSHGIGIHDRIESECQPNVQM